jgi:hypothetical protein
LVTAVELDLFRQKGREKRVNVLCPDVDRWRREIPALIAASPIVAQRWGQIAVVVSFSAAKAT